jgi:hypothetical protein
MLERTLMLCRHVYNAAVGERREAWQKRGVSVGYYQQKAELPGIKEAMPEYGAVHSQVLQDVVQRVDCAFQSLLSSRKGWRDARIPPLPRTQPLHQSHLPAVRQRSYPGQRLPGPVEDGPHRGALESPD